MRLILADPQNLVRAALKRYVEALPGIEVIGDTDNGKDLLDLATRLHPDLVLSEFALPDINGLDLAQSIRRHFPAVGLIFVASSSDPGQVRAALKLGACGFLTKSCEPQELELAINGRRKGQIYIGAELSRRMLDGRRPPRGETGTALTRRQREVLRLIGGGKSTKEIAQVMGLSAKTVETHRARLMQSLGLRGASALTHFAVRNMQYQSD